MERAQVVEVVLEVEVGGAAPAVTWTLRVACWPFEPWAMIP